MTLNVLHSHETTLNYSHKQDMSYKRPDRTEFILNNYIRMKLKLGKTNIWG